MNGYLVACEMSSAPHLIIPLELFAGDDLAEAIEYAERVALKRFSRVAPTGLLKCRHTDRIGVVIQPFIHGTPGDVSLICFGSVDELIKEGS